MYGSAGTQFQQNGGIRADAATHAGPPAAVYVDLAGRPVHPHRGVHVAPDLEGVRDSNTNRPDPTAARKQ
nr:hypothetical protein GCM10017745_46880 [Saccharothrix mutabilis subsp. capreolus]